MWARIKRRRKIKTDCPLEFNDSLNQLLENKSAVRDAIISLQQQVWFGYSLLPGPYAVELYSGVDDLHCSTTMWVVFKSSRRQSEPPHPTPVIIACSYYTLLEFKLFMCLEIHWSQKLYSVSFWHFYAGLSTALLTVLQNEWKWQMLISPLISFLQTILPLIRPSLHFPSSQTEIWQFLCVHFGVRK